jgi:hypothetical protein
MRRRRMELAYVSLLHAVPKAWRVTVALTHRPAVELCAVGVAGRWRQCFVLGSFFNIYYLYLPEKESLLHSEIGFHNVSVEKQLSFTHPKNLCLKVLVNYQ